MTEQARNRLRRAIASYHRCRSAQYNRDGRPDMAHFHGIKAAAAEAIANYMDEHSEPPTSAFLLPQAE